MARPGRAALARRGPDELAAMRRAGRVVAEIHDAIREAAVPGATTLDLDGVARDVLERRGATSSFLGYHGYPAAICASPNQVVIHGIPDGRPLTEGDLLSIDVGAIVDGWHGDAAFTMAIGSIAPEAQRLLDTADAALRAGIATLVPGGRLGDYGEAVQRVIEAAGFSVVRDYVGHGIGRAMHEPPDVPNHGRAGKGLRLVEGNTLAVEPMLVAGDPTVVELADGWTIVTLDGSLAAHVEHTVAVTGDGPEILTRR